MDYDLSFETMKGPELTLFYAFVCVWKHQSYSRAAHVLKCPQSTVSRRVKALETWLGETLFTQNIPPKLTETGEYILRISVQFLLHIDGIRSVACKSSDPKVREAAQIGLMHALERYSEIDFS